MTPVKTIIRNKKSVAKSVNYIGKGTTWLPANGEVTVDFEIWSVANNTQRTAIKTLCANGDLELSVMLLGPNGEYTVVPFDPVGGKKAPPVVEEKKEEPAILNPVKQMVDEKDHIVKVGSPESKAILEDMGAKAIGFKDEPLPAREVKNGDPEDKEEAPQDDATIMNADNVATENVEEAPKKASKKSSKQKA